MKKLTVLLMFIITIFLHGYSLGADWQYYEKSVDGSWFYDAESIVTLPGGITRVWCKLVINDDGRKGLVKIEKEFENLAFLVDLYEINCTMRETKVIKSDSIANNGSVLDSSNTPQKDWNAIRPGSLTDSLYKAVCTKKPRSARAKWIKFGESQFGNHFYDAESIDYPTKGMVLVWYKIIYTEEGRSLEINNRSKIGLSIKEFDKMAYEIGLSEINCTTKEDSTVKMIYYHKNGSVIDSHTFVDKSSNAIKSGTVLNDLFRIVCTTTTKRAKTK